MRSKGHAQPARPPDPSLPLPRHLLLLPLAAHCGSQVPPAGSRACPCTRCPFSPLGSSWLLPPLGRSHPCLLLATILGSVVTLLLVTAAQPLAFPKQVPPCQDHSSTWARIQSYLTLATTLPSGLLPHRGGHRGKASLPTSQSSAELGPETWPRPTLTVAPAPGGCSMNGVHPLLHPPIHALSQEAAFGHVMQFLPDTYQHLGAPWVPNLLTE